MPQAAPVLVDAHVHGHGCFRRDDVFARAVTNFRAARARLGLPGEGADALLLAEGAGEDFYVRCREAAGRSGGGDWTLEETDDPEALRVAHRGVHALTLVAGRQLACEGGLELLALGTEASLPDGGHLADRLDDVRGAGALAVVPWGFGKWWLGRGARVAALVEAADPSTTFLGDNGGRPGLWREPRLFARARRRGLRILPGSDPLPFPAQVSRVGSHGFVLERPLDARAPWSSLKAALAGTKSQPRTFGTGERLGRFAVNQVRMQLRKRLRKGAAA